MKQKHILILGAGIAGLAAAERLKTVMNVTLLEAQNRIGGRIRTFRARSFPLDLGAQVIHGAYGNPLTKLVKKLGIETVPSDYFDYALYDKAGKCVSAAKTAAQEKKFRSILKAISKHSRRIAKNTSLEDAMNLSPLKKEIDPALWNWFKESEEIYSGGDLKKQSARHYDQSNDYPGPNMIFPHGYDQILNAFNLEGISMQFNCAVRRISWAKSGVCAETDRGMFDADYALITLPLGVLKDGQIRFSPQLPGWKLAAIKRLDMGVLNLIHMRFSKVFWPQNHNFIGVAGQDNPFTRFADRSRIQNIPVLTGITGGDDAVKLESLSDEAIAGLAVKALRVGLGHQVPQPVEVEVTRWARDPYTRGSYSFIPKGASWADYNTLARPVAGRLFFAGEATHARHPCTVHGAYLSGLREARRFKASRGKELL